MEEDYVSTATKKAPVCWETVFEKGLYSMETLEVDEGALMSVRKDYIRLSVADVRLNH